MKSSIATPPKSRLEAVRAALTAAGEPEPSRPALTATYELTQGPVALQAFYKQALDEGLSELYTEAWPTDALDIGSGATFKEGDEDRVMAVFRAGQALVLATLRGGVVIVSVAGANRDAISEAVQEFRSRFPFAATPADDLVPVTFWSYGQFGPQSYTRRIAVSPWGEIDGNYTASVREQLDGMMSGFDPGRGGQLLLWQGPPGTGKTWALRALASEWREWADVHYITDPDAFFGEHADYMVEVLLRESYSYDVPEGDDPTEKWRVLVLEDTGELLASNAKEKSGQALSRLLNVVDGLIGQGLRVLVLITTNDEIESFHPAVSRPGRCAVQIEFAPLTAEEVAAWSGSEEEDGATLAELYARDGKDGSLTSDATPNLGLMSEVFADAIPAPAPADERPARQPAAEVALPEAQTNAAQVNWEAILLVEDSLTEDGRYIEPGATSWRELPLSLMAMTETQEGHTGAELCGRIDRIWREGNLVMGSGVFLDTDFGHEIATLVADKFLTGNSVDLAVREFELAPRSDFDEEGHRVREADDQEQEVDLIDLLFGDSEPQVFVFKDCVIGMSTVCPFPAFADASISVTASALQWRVLRQSGMILVAAAPPPPKAAPEVEVEPEAAEDEPDEALTAAVEIPETPPAEWFRDPELEGPTPLTVTEDGRVYGHAALWNTCHIGIADVCTTAPLSMTNYAYFLLGEVEVEDGDPVAVGHITLGTGHAAKHLKRQAAAAHYDNSGLGAADVACGEDAHGIWVSGALRPGLTAERVRELRASVLSGDWRNVNGNLELVALLAVNVPGFPVPRSPRALLAGAADGVRVLSLVAAGLNLERVRLDLTAREQAKMAALAARADGGFKGLAELAARESA